MRADPKRYTNGELAIIFQNIAGNGLWSSWGGPPRLQAAPLSVRVYLRYSDLLTDAQDLKQQYWDALQKAPRVNTVVILSMISGLLSPGSGDPSLHALLNEQFLPKDLKERVLAYRRDDPVPSVVFNRVGCLHLMRHLLRYGTDTPGVPPRTENVGALILLANEFLHDDSLSLPAEPSDLEVAALTAPTWDVYNPRDLAYAMSRMHSIIEEILCGDDPEVCRLSEAAGIDSKRISIGDIPLVDFLAIVFGLYSHGRKMTTNVKSAVFNTDEIFKKIGPAQILPQFMSARSPTPIQFREQLGEGAKPSRNEFFQELENRSFIKSAMVDFRRRQLMRLDEKHAVILDLQFLVDLLTVGVYYSIFDSLPQERRERFRELWGRMFELYAGGLLREAYPENAGIFRTDAKFAGGQVDALLDFGQEVLIFEIKSCLLREDAKRGARSNVFEADVNKKFVRNQRGEAKGVTQLAKSCHAVLEGKLGTVLRRAQIYPILLSDEPACEVPCFNSYLNGIFRSELGSLSTVKPLTVLSINEFEEVMGLVSEGILTWPGLLDTRFDHDGVGPVSVHQDLYNWLRSRGIKEVRNEARRAKFEKASAEIMRRYQPPPGTSQ